MKINEIKNIHNGLKDFFLSPDVEVKTIGLISVIKELAVLLSEDEGHIAGRYIGLIGHESETELINRVIKEFHLKLAPGYRFIPDSSYLSSTI